MTVEQMAAFEELQTAAAVFKQAVTKFGTVHDPETVGLDEFCEHIDDVLYDIKESMNGD